jgi:hypothetical protein
MRLLLEALSFHVKGSNYDEQQILEEGPVYFVCPIEEDDRRNRARVVLTDIRL